MRVGLGRSSGEIFVHIAAAGEAALAVVRTVEQRFREWPEGPSQLEVKELEHAADRVVSELISLTNTLFVTPYDRDDLIALAFAIDDVADAAENAAELLGLYGVETTTRQSLELCALLVEAAEELAQLLSGLKGLRGASERVVRIKGIEDR
ncbi:MAG: DUF47 domain-containing protein, partial [Gaiellaceae bacterium]